MTTGDRHVNREESNQEGRYGIGSSPRARPSSGNSAQSGTEEHSSSECPCHEVVVSGGGHPKLSHGPDCDHRMHIVHLASPMPSLPRSLEIRYPTGLDCFYWLPAYGCRPYVLYRCVTGRPKRTDEDTGIYVYVERDRTYSLYKANEPIAQFSELCLALSHGEDLLGSKLTIKGEPTQMHKNR